MYQGTNLAYDVESIVYSAKSLQQLTRTFKEGSTDVSDMRLFHGQMVAGPVLLTFAMELALKAWWLFENRGEHAPKTHDLLKLFKGLKKSTQQQLQTAYPEIPDPYSAKLPPAKVGLTSLLEANRLTFVTWRYMHEKRVGVFYISQFDDALSAVIMEFEKAYKTQLAQPY